MNFSIPWESLYGSVTHWHLNLSLHCPALMWEWKKAVYMKIIASGVSHSYEKSRSLWEKEKIYRCDVKARWSSYYGVLTLPFSHFSRFHVDDGEKRLELVMKIVTNACGDVGSFFMQKKDFRITTDTKLLQDKFQGKIWKENFMSKT